jgi:hypothetical protein
MLGAFFLIGGSAGAIEIYYEATDLTDINIGEDSWQYTYTVTDHTFAVDEGFTIFFELGLYDFLDPFPAAPNADWDVLTWDPDPSVPDDGAYDALSWVDNPSLDDSFTVSFVWLGGNEGPGSQFYELYYYDWFDDTFEFLGEGETIPAAPVPEPTTMILLGTGLVGLAGFRKRFKK